MDDIAVTAAPAAERAAPRGAVPPRPRGRAAFATRRAALALLLLAPGCAASKGGPPVRIALDSTVRYQRISGWEFTTQAGQDDAPLALYRDRLLGMAADLGLNRVRLEVRSGAENTRDYWSEMKAGRLRESWRCVRYATVNDNADPNVINWAGFHFGDLDQKVEQIVLPMKKLLESRGEKLFVNLEYLAFHRQCPNVPYIHYDPAEYAEFILAVSLHLREKYGLVPDAWELVLEPDNGTSWGGEQLGRAVVATASRLQAAGFTPRFIGPSTKSMANAAPYFDELARVPGALRWMSEISYHRYGGTSPANLRAIAERAERYHLGSAMLEHIGSGFEDLQRDLEIGHVSAWQQYALAYPAKSDNGGVYFLLVSRDGQAPQVVPGKRTLFLRQYFHYIRAGAVRIGASGDDPDFDPLAFVNDDGRYVVVVKADAPGSVAISGLPAGRYLVSYTTDDGASPEAAVSLARGGTLRAAIPARGVLTIAQTGKAVAAR